MLEFKSVFYKNFQSVGNAGIRVELGRSATTLVGGHNGAGKSTLLEAISYGLFGKPLKKVNLAGLINTINGKAMTVEIEFTKNGVNYKIVRGQKPAKLEFYVNDELVDQSAASKDYQAKIEYVLGMDFKLFTQIVVLNKEKYVPFMELTAGDRRKVVEDVLDISVFSVMNDVVKDEFRNLSATINDLKYTRERLQERMTGQQRLIDAAEANVADQIKACQAEIDELSEKIACEEEIIERMQGELCEQDKIVADLTAENKKKRQFEEIAHRFAANSKRFEEEAEFFKVNDTCPTCKQDIDVETKDARIEASNGKVAEIKANSVAMMKEYQKVVDRIAELTAAADEVQRIRSAIRVSQVSCDNWRRDADRKAAEINRLSASSRVDEYRAELQATTTEFDDASRRLQEAVASEDVLNKCKALLKDDGIKAAIVRDYIEFINARVNEYLNAMEFYLNIRLDENFADSINSVNRQGFTYDNLSTGQKTRVNLAVWLALLEVASIKNSVVTNILFLDEILENLDQEGVAAFMKLVQEKLPHKNAFVVTQRFDEFKDFFRSELRFKLAEGFTEIA